MICLKDTKSGVLLKTHIVPQSSKNHIVGLHGDRLKIKISAPPVDGKANDAILKYLKTLFPHTKIEMIRGETSRAKDFLITTTMNSATQILLKHIKN